jgi:hypothetical protein
MPAKKTAKAEPVEAVEAAEAVETAEPVETAELVTYKVAAGKAITTLLGIKSGGDPIAAAHLAGGAASLDALIGGGHVVESA